jgi:hypothetical protein
MLHDLERGLRKDRETLGKSSTQKEFVKTVVNTCFRNSFVPGMEPGECKTLQRLDRRYDCKLHAYLENFMDESRDQVFGNSQTSSCAKVGEIRQSRKLTTFVLISLLLQMAMLSSHCLIPTYVARSHATSQGPTSACGASFWSLEASPEAGFIPRYLANETRFLAHLIRLAGPGVGRRHSD